MIGLEIPDHVRRVASLGIDRVPIYDEDRWAMPPVSPRVLAALIETGMVGRFTGGDDPVQPERTFIAGEQVDYLNDVIGGLVHWSDLSYEDKNKMVDYIPGTEHGLVHALISVEDLTLATAIEHEHALETYPLLDQIPAQKTDLISDHLSDQRLVLDALDRAVAVLGRWSDLDIPGGFRLRVPEDQTVPISVVRPFYEDAFDNPRYRMWGLDPAAVVADRRQRFEDEYLNKPIAVYEDVGIPAQFVNRFQPDPPCPNGHNRTGKTDHPEEKS